MRHFLSRYRPRYVRSLVYMLQASEYNISDYLGWLHRVSDFGVVEKRKRLRRTPKALLMLAFAWGVVGAMGLLALRFFLLSSSAGYLLGAAVIIAFPYVLAYGIIVPLFVVQIFVQKPFEYFIIRRAKFLLAKHRGVKIAIAGSFGKTTMREILKAVLSEGRSVAAPPESYNTLLGISSFVKTLMGDEEVLIFELGEYYPGDVRRLCEFVQPDIGIITGVNEAHLQKFKTLDSTARTIYELADHLADKPMYVNGESELALKRARPGHSIYSRAGTSECKIEDAKTDLGGVSFTLRRGESVLKLSSSLLGLHQVGPLAAAADIAFRLGLSEEEVRSGIESTRPFAHRLEPRMDGAGVTIIDDTYNGNPDGVKAAIDFLASLKERRRLYVTPGLVEMGARTEAVHTDIGRWLADAGIEKVVLIKNSVTPYIEAGLRQAGYTGEVMWFNDALQAFSALPHLTVEGDVVLLQNDWPDQYA